jgi:hypothetical protein
LSLSFDANLVESDGVADLINRRIYITKAAVFFVYLEALLAYWFSA